MILRRIAEAFRRQDWFTVFVETMIVVLGVFLGLQANNWNAARADRIRADGYLERIAADLDADLKFNHQAIEFWRRVSGYGARALAYAETGDAKGANQWDLLLAYFQASQLNEIVITNTTYEELKSAGELALISDPSLRDGLARYYALGVNPTTAERPLYRMHVREIIPVPVQAYIWDSCYSVAARDGNQDLRACAAPIAAEDAAIIVDAIRNDAALMGELRYWLSTLHVADLITRRRIEDATALREAVRRQTGKPQRERAP